MLCVDMGQFKLTELQEDRFKVLVGCRYDVEKKRLRMSLEQFPTY